MSNVTSEPIAIILNGSQAHGTLDDTPTLYYSDYSSHGNATYANGARVSLENLLRAHGSNRSGDGRIPHVEHLVVEYDRHARHYKPPHGKRAKGDVERVFQANDIAETEDGSAGVDLEYQFRLVGKVVAKSYDA